MADTFPNGLTIPSGLPPPQLPLPDGGGLNVPPGLPHPDVTAHPDYRPTDITPYSMAKAAAPHIGFDPTEFAAPQPNVMASGEPQARLQAALNAAAQARRMQPDLRTQAIQNEIEQERQMIAAERDKPVAERLGAIPGEVGSSLLRGTIGFTPGDIGNMMSGKATLPDYLQAAVGVLGMPAREPVMAPEGVGGGAGKPPVEPTPEATEMAKAAAPHIGVDPTAQDNRPPPEWSPPEPPIGSIDWNAIGSDEEAAQARYAHGLNYVPRAEIAYTTPDRAANRTAPLRIVPSTPEEHIASVTGDEAPKVVSDKQVPYLAGSSNDGSTLYLSPLVPKEMTIKATNGGDVTIDPSHPLAVHEGVEHNLMLKGVPYETAHRVALGEEQKVVNQLGGDWQSYQNQMHPLAEQAEKQPIKEKDLPPDLYAKPYAHTDLYPKVEAAEKVTPTTAEPAKPSGTIRYYHGHYGTDPTNYEAWVTPRQDYAKNYGMGGRDVSYIDLTKDQAIAHDLYDEINNYPHNGQLSLELSKNLKPLTSAPAAQQAGPTSAPAVTQGIAAGKPSGSPAAGPPSPPGGGSLPPGPPSTGAAAGPPGPLPDVPPRASIRRMEDDLFAINARDNARHRLEFEQLGRMKGTPGVEQVDTGVYHKREAGQQLTPEEEKYNRQWIEPLRQNTDAMKTELRQIMGKNYDEELGPISDPNYMHRMVIGSTPAMDRAMGVGDIVGYGKGRGMSRTPPSSKGRSIFAMEDEAGNRKIVTAYPGGDGVYSWQGGRAQREVGAFIRTKPSETIPGGPEMGRTTLPRPVPARAEMEPQVEGKKQGVLTKAYTVPSKQIPDTLHTSKMTEPQLINDYFRPGSEFVDMNNKRWFMKQATTQEIHDAGVKHGPLVRTTDSQGNTQLQAGPPVRYYESALGSELMDNLQVSRALDNARTMQKIQNSPEFKKYSIDANDATPEQKREMTRIDYPGWEGRFYDRRYAEPILDHMQNGPGARMGWWARINNASLATLFKTGIGSVAHMINVHFQRALARGLTGNLNPIARYKSFAQAWDETQNRGPIWQDYRNHGASFPSDRLHERSIGEQLFQALGKKAEVDPGMIAAAKRMGMDVKEYVGAKIEALGRAAFRYGDFLSFQHGLELERRGWTRDQAIEQLNRTLPTYRIPSRTGLRGQAGRVVSQALGTKSVTAFGPFEYAKFKALSSIVEDMLGGSHIKGISDSAARWNAVNRATYAAVMLGVLSPLVINPILRKITGDPNARFTYGGSLGMLSRMIRSADDIVHGRDNIFGAFWTALNLTNIAPATKEAISQVMGRHGTDPFTGKPIVGQNVGGGTEAAERLFHAAPALVQPLQAFKDPMRYLMEPAHISEAKPFNLTPRSMSSARQEAFTNARIPGSQIIPRIERFFSQRSQGEPPTQ